MGAGWLQIVRFVFLPSILPGLFTGMRLGMSATLLGILLAELYVTASGIGHYTHVYTDSFQPAKLFALVGVAIIAAGGYLATVLGTPVVLALAVFVAVVYFVGLTLLSSVQGSVFRAALYVYAKEGHAQGSFGEEMLKNAFRSK